MKEKIKVIGVVGPTASGKTKLSIELAKVLDAEIVSADSMQIYKEMTIASAKPTKEEMQGIKHHLIDIISLDENFSVYDYVNLAKKAIDDIIGRKKRVILCGGTGLYVDSLLNNTKFTDYDVDLELRDRLNKKAQELGGEELLKELCEFDKEASQKIHPNNIKKIVRALEIYYTTKKSMTDHIKESHLEESPYESIMIGLNYRNRASLYDKINRRVDIMIENGLIDESMGIFEKGYNSTSAAAIGYKELIPYFNGEVSMEEAISKIKQESRRYAKRQLTWFRRNQNINWLYIDDYNSFDLLKQSALDIIKSKLV